ncbi:MAG: hypothetical protein AB7P02_22430 [Alphaproteobacteria bacterium]
MRTTSCSSRSTPNYRSEGTVTQMNYVSYEHCTGPTPTYRAWHITIEA